MILNRSLIFHRYATVIFSTGPMFLTHEATFSSERSSISVLSQELYGKYVYNSSRSLFKHLKGKEEENLTKKMSSFFSFSFILAWK